MKYKVFFAVKLGNSKSLNIKNLVFDLPDELIYTDLQIKILENNSFKKVFEYGDCSCVEDVSFVSAAIIPDVEKIKNIKVDIAIGSGNWV